MKLTKKQIHELNTILSNINRAYNYLQRDAVKGIAEEIAENRALGSDYELKNKVCVEVCTDTVPFIRLTNKRIGSDIAGLSFAKSQLEAFILANQE